MPKQFITNNQNYFFVIDLDKSHFNPAKLKDCKQHKDLMAMYSHVMNAHGLLLDEVEGNEILFELHNNVVLESDSRGVFLEAEFNNNNNLEEYISEFVL